MVGQPDLVALGENIEKKTYLHAFMRNARNTFEPWITDKTSASTARALVRQLEMGLVRLALSKSQAQSSILVFNSGVCGKYTPEKAKLLQDNWVRFVMTQESLGEFAHGVSYPLPAAANSAEVTPEDVPCHEGSTPPSTTPPPKKKQTQT